MPFPPYSILYQRGSEKLCAIPLTEQQYRSTIGATGGRFDRKGFAVFPVFVRYLRKQVIPPSRFNPGTEERQIGLKPDSEVLSSWA
jgi:hypothetical protein